MNKNRIPLLEALIRHKDKSPISFHVPGHKYGQVLPEQVKGIFKDILPIDATELSGLDDLHQPEDVIQEAQQLTAELYKVKSSYFLVGGSTAGNLAALLSVGYNGGTILVQRNCHKSVINGLELAGLQPVFLMPEYDTVSNTPASVSLTTVKKALEQYPDAVCLFLSNPSYYGLTKDLTEIIEFMHNHDLPVIVDEAHGAHFIVSDHFPLSAVDAGADVVIHSAHKTLPAMTMGSYLHVNGDLVDIDKIEHYLQVVQSSSPSYPIMASLDASRYYLSQLNEDRIDAIIKSFALFRNKLKEVKQIHIIDSVSVQVEMDPLKMIIQTNCKLSGFDIQRLLEEEGIFTELADPFNVLFVLPLSPIEELEINRIVEKIKKVLSNYTVGKMDVFKPTQYKRDIVKLPYSFDTMKKMSKTYIPLKDAVGKITADSVIPYPPGIPLLMTGEEVTSDHIKELLDIRENGGKIQSRKGIWSEGIRIFNIKE